VIKGRPRYLKQDDTGRIYIWTEELAKRPDMRDYERDVETGPLEPIQNPIPLSWQYHELHAIDITLDVMRIFAALSQIMMAFRSIGTVMCL
jgi:hypothetical protein